MDARRDRRARREAASAYLPRTAEARFPDSVLALQSFKKIETEECIIG